MSQDTVVPRHIALIMDGNRRWARANARAILHGHQYVSDQVIEPLAERCIERGVTHLTLWAFSTENWNRESQEVEGLMKIFRDGLQRNGERLHQKGIRLRAIGDLDRFPADIRDGMQRWINETAANTRLTITFALNYGGRDEILRAIHRATQTFTPAQLEHLTEEQFASVLDTAELPDPDLIIRPGGEQRLSGYLPWQSVYSELYFTDVLMPDFTPAELDKALDEYAQRSRRFGK